jgi:hypothetical protein
MRAQRKDSGVFYQLQPANVQFVDAHFWYSFMNSTNRAEQAWTRAYSLMSFTLESKYNNLGNITYSGKESTV